MQDLLVSTKTKAYKIHIRKDFLDLPRLLKEQGLTGRKVCIVTDSNVESIYLSQVLGILKDVYEDIFTVSFEAGEKNKTLETVEKLYEGFLNNKMDRSSLVIALGGGVTGDMAAFAASTYMRGISFIQIPTTLLSQVDSSVGGKTGVDFKGNKNLVGVFSQPEFVYINIETLRTLPTEHIASGMAEVIKHGLIASKDYYDFIHSNKEEIQALKDDVIVEIVRGSCQIKAKVVSQDETESKGIREILNFGHTFGHAFETLSDFQLLHGDGVAIGMSAALHLSYKMGKISLEELCKAKEIIKAFGLNTSISGYTPEEVMDKMTLDKKTKNNIIQLILLDEIGEAFIYKAMNKDEIIDAIKSVLF